MITLDALFEASTSVLLAILFRLVPFICFALLSRRLELVDKLVATILFVGSASLVLRNESNILTTLGDIASIYAFWVVLLFVLLRVWSRLANARIARATLLVVGCVGWTLVPIALSRSELRTGLVIVGIDGALSVVSYLLGASSSAWRPAAFFVLVDPNICFRQSASLVKEPHFSLGVVLRSMRGFVALLVGFVLLGRSGELMLALPLGPGPWTPAVRFVAASVALCAGFYATHAGLADVQTAAMRSLGYAVGERYVGPLRALSPGDFWSRWNTYMAGWLRDHVYLPTARALGQRIARPLASDVAVLATFLVSGCIHIAAQRATRGVVPWPFFVFFLVNGVAVVVWSRLQRFFGPSGKGSSSPRMHVVLSRTAFLAFIVIAVGVGFVL